MHTPREISCQDLVADQGDKDDVVWLIPEENKTETVDVSIENCEKVSLSIQAGTGDHSVYAEPECAACTARSYVRYATTGVGGCNLNDAVTVKVLCPQCNSLSE